MTIKKIVIATLLTTTVSVSAQASELKAGDQSSETTLCLTAASGNRAAMHNEIKNSGKSLNYIANNITCNGENILAFVDKYGKNSENMLKALDRSTRHVSITDIAKSNIDVK